MIYQTTEEQILAAEAFGKRMEEEFIEYGELFMTIKKRRIHKVKRYSSFKHFVEAEFNLEYGFISKLINTYKLYVQDLDIDEEYLKKIGFAKLQTVKNAIKKAYDGGSPEYWLERAETGDIADLKDDIADARKRTDKNNKTFKEIFAEQEIKKLCEHFQCSKKELNFKLALLFQSLKLDEVDKIIKENQSSLEQNLVFLEMNNEE